VLAGFCDTVGLLELVEWCLPESVHERVVARVERAEVRVAQPVPHQEDAIPAHLVFGACERFQVGSDGSDAD